MGKAARRKEKSARRKDGTPTSSSPPPVLKQSLEELRGRLWRPLAAMVTGLGTYVTIFGFVLPKLTVEPMEMLNPKDPYTQVFRIQNQGNLDLLRVDYSCKVKGAYIDGRSAPITVVGDEHEWMHIGPGIDGEVFRTLGSTETDNFSCKLFKEPFPFMLNDKREIAIVIGYRPAYLPFRVEREFHFYLRTSGDNGYHWIPVASQRE